jgi:class 3 adenylate cyclase
LAQGREEDAFYKFQRRCRSQETNPMPIYMDRHHLEGATRHAVAADHQKDRKIEGKYGVRFITYWFDEVRFTAFCLVEAPNKEAIQRAHDEAHGNIPSEIIEVHPAVVEAFLGRVNDPLPPESGSQPQLDAGLRAIMFTDLKDSTAMTRQLGEARALELLRVHNALTRKALREHAGREVKHLGDGIMASFTSTDQALECAIAIQRSFAEHNLQNTMTPLHLRIGLSVGEPVEDNNDLFGATVQLASRLCTHAKPNQILAAEAVIEQSAGQRSQFSSRGLITPKGFDVPIQVYEVLWQSA